MSAAIYTDDEERRFKLPPLPDVPWIGVPACHRLQERYEDSRVAHRLAHPARDVKVEP